MAELRCAEGLTRGVDSPPELPVVFYGEVVKGFGRGSKELGCPTANIPIEPYEALLDRYPCGVYSAFASFDGESEYKGKIYAAALSIGWNPFYKNEKKTIEAHLIHPFADDFYGQQLRLHVVDYIRPEWNFTSLGTSIYSRDRGYRHFLCSLSLLRGAHPGHQR